MSPRKPHLDLFGDRRSAAPERPGEPGHATEALPRPGAGRAGGLPESLLSAPDTAAAAEVGPPAAGCDDPLAPFWETPLTFELNTIGHWQTAGQFWPPNEPSHAATLRLRSNAADGGQRWAPERQRIIHQDWSGPGYRHGVKGEPSK